MPTSLAFAIPTRLSQANDLHPDQHCGPRRPHADGAAHAARRRTRGARGLRQARDVQPGRVGQGPHRRGDDRGGRGRGPDRARPHHDRRGHERQHRHRARVRVRRQGLRPDPHAPAGHEPRARGAAAALRRPGARHGVDGRHERGGRRRAGDGARRRRLPARPVLQPGQPRGPPPHDRARSCGRRWTARSTTSSPASAPAARSPAPAAS